MSGLNWESKVELAPKRKPRELLLGSRCARCAVGKSKSPIKGAKKARRKRKGGWAEALNSLRRKKRPCSEKKKKGSPSSGEEPGVSGGKDVKKGGIRIVIICSVGGEGAGAWGKAISRKKNTRSRRKRKKGGTRFLGQEKVRKNGLRNDYP